MKKADLLKHIPEQWPTENTAKIIKTPGMKALMMLLPGWQVVGHSHEQCIAHFVWKDGYLTYYPESNLWDRRKYDSLYYNSYVSGGKFDDKSYEAINSFTDSYSHYGAIESFERNIDYVKSEKAMERKQKRIDESMKDTPRLPNGFRAKVLKMFDNQPSSKIAVKLFQPYKNGTMERIFQVEDYEYKARGGAVTITEICRSYQDKYGGRWKSWMYGEIFGLYGNRQHFWDKKDQSLINNLPVKHYVYDNLDSLDMTNAQKDVLRALSGRVDPSIALSRLAFHPDIEYVAKKGLLRVAAEMVNNGTNEEYIRELPRAAVERLKKFDGGCYAAELLSLAPKIEDRYLKDFCKIKEHSKAESIISLAAEYNINHVYKILMPAGGMTNPVISKYRDYLRMAQELGNNPHDEIIYRNKRWEEWHDRYLEEINKHKDKLESKKYPAIRKDYKLNKSIFAWEDEGYLIMVPRSAADINEEGRRQHHCVGAQSHYKDNMEKRIRFIVFLRKADNPKEPYYTIECDFNKVFQFYAAYDRQPDRDKVQKILTKWMKQVRKNIKKLQKAAG